MSEPKRFYILDTRTIVGNCGLWWRPDGSGYTTELSEAGLYSEEYARSRRDTDLAVPEEIAKASTVTHVRVDTLRSKLHDAGIRWPKAGR